MLASPSPGEAAAIVCGPPPPLTSDEVHLWSTPLDVEPEIYQTLVNCLTADERKRADQFRFETDRQRFRIARAVLRHILGAYLRRAPHQVQIRYGPHGKPSLAPEESTAICFNLAHSDAFALIALTEGRAVGVDLERIRPALVTEQLAAAILSPVELRRFRSLPPKEQAQAFFSIWTRKEAYLKAEGVGLSRRVDDIEVLRADDWADLGASRRHEPQWLDGWIISSLTSAAGYAAAVAIGVEAVRADGAARGEPRRTGGSGAPFRGITRPVGRSAPCGIAQLEVLCL
jgi:4'-phosphopantetheinyl transferase